MASNLLFYQLLLVALVLICLLVHGGLPDDLPRAPQTLLQPHQRRRRRSKEPQPFTGLIHKPLCEGLYGRGRSLPYDAQLATAAYHLHTKTPAHRRYLWAFLSRSRLLVSRLARPRQYPRQRPSRWPALAPVPMRLVPGLFL